MKDPKTAGLEQVFSAVAEALHQRQSELNAADSFNGNHGDHMVEIFGLAARVAGETDPADLPAVMLAASQRLKGKKENGSALVYGRGLEQFGLQFKSHDIKLPDLLLYVRQLIADSDHQASPLRPEIQKSMLKALVTGLSAWKKAENLEPGNSAQEVCKTLDLGSLFDLGIIYLQAKARGGTRLEVIADAAAHASPLAQTPQRLLSGKLALEALLEAMS